MPDELTMDEARAMLRETCDTLRSGAALDAVQRAAMADALAAVERRLYRRPAVRKAPVQAAPLTPALIEQIRERAAQNPTATQAQIAAALDLNPGRVSEVLAGQRR